MRFTPGTPAPSVLARMTGAQQATPGRGLGRTGPTDLPLDTPEEALILASIIEKETGVAGRAARRWPASSSTGWIGGCGCRPTRR